MSPTGLHVGSNHLLLRTLGPIRQTSYTHHAYYHPHHRSIGRIHPFNFIYSIRGDPSIKRKKKKKKISRVPNVVSVRSAIRVVIQPGSIARLYIINWTEFRVFPFVFLFHTFCNIRDDYRRCGFISLVWSLPFWLHWLLQALHHASRMRSTH